VTSSNGKHLASCPCTAGVSVRWPATCATITARPSAPARMRTTPPTARCMPQRIRPTVASRCPPATRPAARSPARN